MKQETEIREHLDGWLIRSIAPANHLETLEHLQRIIRDDTREGYEYTTDKKYMDKARETWIERKKTLLLKKQAKKQANE